MANIPDWLMRHKEIYERHQRGETYTALAREQNISAGAVRDLALRWEQELNDRKLDNDTIKSSQVFKLEPDGKYLIVFSEPLSDEERARIEIEVENWLALPDRPIAILGGAKIMIAKGR